MPGRITQIGAPHHEHEPEQLDEVSWQTGSWPAYSGELSPSDTASWKVKDSP